MNLIERFIKDLKHFIIDDVAVYFYCNFYYFKIFLLILVRFLPLLRPYSGNLCQHRRLRNER